MTPSRSDRYKISARRWREENKSRVQAYQRARRAKLKAEAQLNKKISYALNKEEANAKKAKQTRLSAQKLNEARRKKREDHLREVAEHRENLWRARKQREESRIRISPEDLKRTSWATIREEQRFVTGAACGMLPLDKGPEREALIMARHAMFLSNRMSG